MKKIYILAFISLIITSCFRKEHRIANIELNGLSKSMNNSIELCLEESIGYESYHLKFISILKNGTEIKTETTLRSPTNSEKKCFKIYLGASFTHRHTQKKETELIEQIFKNNVKEMTITIFDERGNEEIRTQTFKNL